eukprot:TRINITY_DN41719_c0_g1_i1.p1 TRINITY_DN41719_c0_g1~~TRINITY_DN41719_c0_g1_i1.p1  ORF type:complete len:868 (-),score=228.39 TRINITY_DN41719_c0_g1_i1:157-2760(-)
MTTLRRASTAGHGLRSPGSSNRLALELRRQRSQSPDGGLHGMVSHGSTSVSSSSRALPLSSSKELESMCLKALDGLRALEPLLRRLQSDHDALRAEAQAVRNCLNRKGVLPSCELEQELEQCHQLQPQASLQSSCDSLSGSPQVPNMPEPPSRLVLPLRSLSAARERSRERQNQLEVRSVSPLGRRISRSPETVPVYRQGISAPSAPSSRRRGGSCRASAGIAAITAAARSRQRSRSPEEGGGLTAAEVNGDRDTSAAAVLPVDSGDTYELLRFLVEQQGSSAEQLAAMHALQQHLKVHPEATNAWNGPGTPLQAVVRAGRPDLAKVLLRARALPNERDAKGVTPLHLATFDGNLDLCRTLLWAHAEVDACDRHGQTPLFFAPTREACKLLIEKRADVTVLNRRGQSALHLAARAGLHDVLHWLSGRVARSLVELRDLHGNSAKHYALQSAAVAAASAGASEAAAAAAAAAAAPEVVVRSPDSETSAFDSAAGRGRSGSPVEALPSVSELIEKAANSQGTTPTDVGFQVGHLSHSSPFHESSSLAALSTEAGAHATGRSTPGSSTSGRSRAGSTAGSSRKGAGKSMLRAPNVSARRERPRESLGCVPSSLEARAKLRKEQALERGEIAEAMASICRPPSSPTVRSPGRKNGGAAGASPGSAADAASTSAGKASSSAAARGTSPPAAQYNLFEEAACYRLHSDGEGGSLAGLSPQMSARESHADSSAGGGGGLAIEEMYGSAFSGILAKAVEQPDESTTASQEETGRLALLEAAAAVATAAVATAAATAAHGSEDRADQHVHDAEECHDDGGDEELEAAAADGGEEDEATPEEAEAEAEVEVVADTGGVEGGGGGDGGDPWADLEESF